MQTRTRTELAAVWPPTTGVVHETGHRRQSALKAIRAKCFGDFEQGAPFQERSGVRP
jgi:hypothetical protein